MEWQYLHNAWWFFILIGFVLIAMRLYQWRKKSIQNFADVHLLPQIISIDSNRQFILRALAFGLSIFLIVFALMNPLYGYKEQSIKKEGIDWVIALDLSNSMNAEDSAPNRLLKAKKFIQISLDELSGDRVGLVVFAGNAYSMSPLTSDYQAINSLVESLETNAMLQQGTNTAKAISNSLELLNNKQSTAKVIVLISDGENHEPELDQSIALAQEENVQIISIGVGTKKGGPIPIKENGQTIEFKKDFYGNTIISKLESKYLEQMAEETKGKYIQLNNTKQTVRALMNQISTIEKNQFGEVKTQQKQSIYQWFLGVAILILFIESLTDSTKLFG